MSHLTQLRQRIAAIETIQKTTHAMRITAMSTHSLLQRKKSALHYYQTMITELFSLMTAPKTESKKTGARTALIVVGSQKGLCGVFNTQLIRFFKQHAKLNEQTDIITVGKKITENIQREFKQPVYAAYDTFSGQTFVDITHEIGRIVFTNNTYDTVKIYSNYPRSFFFQEPQETTILPFASNDNDEDTREKALESYAYEPNAESLYNALVHLYIKATIQGILFNSLLAEQAARFTSMDAATRNADDFLSAMQLDYNKMRQAAITRELADLSSSL